MHLLAERFVFWEDDWCFLKEVVKTYQMTPMSSLNLPTSYLSSHLWVYGWCSLYKLREMWAWSALLAASGRDRSLSCMCVRCCSSFIKYCSVHSFITQYSILWEVESRVFTSLNFFLMFQTASNFSILLFWHRLFWVLSSVIPFEFY